jgi:hypothetical protein
MLLWPKPVPKHGVGFHALRHTTATLLFRAGVPAHHGQLILRHADRRTTTKTYAHLLLDDLRTAMMALPELPADQREVIEAEIARGSVLGPLALKENEGPATSAESAVVTGLEWRAIQDSKREPGHRPTWRRHSPIRGRT